MWHISSSNELAAPFPKPPPRKLWGIPLGTFKFSTSRDTLSTVQQKRRQMRSPIFKSRWTQSTVLPRIPDRNPTTPPAVQPDRPAPPPLASFAGMDGAQTACKSLPERRFGPEAPVGSRALPTGRGDF